MKHLTLPGSKSITNRDLILAALCDWKTTLSWVLRSDDTRYMMNALRDLGIEIQDWWERIVVHWWKEKIISQELEIYLGQSGTSIRFLTWLAALMNQWRVTFVWDDRLMERPLGSLIDGIKQLGIKVDTREGNLPPVTVHGWKITSNSIHMDGTVSSQFFTALLNIGWFIDWWLEIIVDWELVSKPYIDMTICELEKFGIHVENNDYKSFRVEVFGKNIPTSNNGTAEEEVFFPNTSTDHFERNITIEWDASALSYIANFIALHGWRITIDNLWDESKQGDYQYLEILKKYFWLDYYSDWKTTTLKAGWIDKISPFLRGRALGGGEINFEDMPDVSMSFMSVAIFLSGDTKITWLKTLNLKECLRIDAMRDELLKLWVHVTSTQDSITIWEFWSFGSEMKKTGWLNKSVKIETYDDHRIAMTFGVLASYLKKQYSEKLEILDPDCVNKTYPKFWDDLRFLEQVDDVHATYFKK